MKKLIVGLFVGVLIGVFAAQFGWAQNAAMARMPARIQQGAKFTIRVTVNKAPNVDGNLFVQANGTGLAGCGLPANQTVCDATNTLPVDTPLGERRITGITFRPNNGGQETNLSISGELSFEVVPHGEIILPSSASVSDIH